MNNLNFVEDLIKSISDQYGNFHFDNKTYNRENHTFKNKLQFYLSSKIYCVPRYILPRFKILSDIILKQEEFSKAYNSLEDERSQKLYIELLAFRVLGPYRVKLTADNDLYWKHKNKTEYLYKNSDANNSLKIEFLNWELKLFDLSEDGFPVKLYYVPEGILATFYLKQYEYKNEKVNIKAQKDDVVIDGGACWGDTALYFANEVKENGKVYSFEFIPQNINIYKQNINLNKNLSERIKLIEHPLWSQKDTDVYFNDNGPASTVNLAPFEGHKFNVKSKSIDSFIQEENLNKLDFIKLDVEGAELPILKGAEESLKKFKPKLAIAVYHSIDEMCSIQNYINSLNIGYKFYIGHFTIDILETVLFAEVN